MKGKSKTPKRTISRLPVKSTQTILPKLFKGMDFFEDVVKGKVNTKTFVYGGGEDQKRTEYEVKTWNSGA